MERQVIVKMVSCMLLMLLLTSSMLSGDSLNETSEKDMNLTRVREGGTPYDPDQSLFPYAIKSTLPKEIPSSGFIESTPEYGPTHGVLHCFTSSYQSSVVRDLVVELTQDDQYDEIAYVWVSSVSQKNTATSMFTSGGANMSKVEFIIGPMDSIWMRDYGPHFIWQNGTLGIVDSHYYQTRDKDNFIPTLFGDDHLHIPTWDMGLFYSGGNFQAGPNRTGFVTALVNVDNPSSQGFNESIIGELYQTYQGIDTLHILPQLPYSVDGTGHIDMWMNIVDEDTVIISEFLPGSNPTAIQITENAVPYMESLGFEVFRTPAWNSGGTHYTYTNAFRVNDRYFIPSYSSGNPSYASYDAEASTNFALAAGPDVEIIEIDCYNIIPAAGAIHCIVKQIPRRIDPLPSVHILYPSGGEILVSGTIQRISWEATDTYNIDCDQIDLYYSIDGGLSYTFIDSTTDTGFYDWLIPDLYSDQMKIKVVATAIDTDQVEVENTEVFTIAPGTQTVYDFSTDAGVDRFGYGYQTINWDSYIDGERIPVSTQIDGLVNNAYVKLSSSDATGGNTDQNRYISPNPSYNYESTHVFEFTIYESTDEIDAIDLLWEGYADKCTQIELYIWDVVEEQWSNGKKAYGQNRYMDNWAGNRDGLLKNQITDDIYRYIDSNSKLTLLVYAERGPNSYAPTNPSFHDYLSVTISQIQTGPILAIDPSSFDFQYMYENQTASTLFEVWNDGSGLLNYSIVETCEWVTISPLSGNSSGEHDIINVTVNTTALSYGPYHCDILIISDVGTQVFEIDVLVVESGTPLIDIDQGLSDRDFRLRPGWNAAQEFVPSYSILSKVELYMTKFASPSGDVTFEIREDSASGTVVFEGVVSPSDVPAFPTYAWVSIDISDISVNPGETYVIVFKDAAGATEWDCLLWGFYRSAPFGSGGPYTDGWFWFQKKFQPYWYPATDWDYTFRTYGI